MNVVGLGNAGCKIAKNFEKYPQYSVYCIDEGLKKTTKTFGITKRDSHQEYDTKQIRMTRFVNNMKDAEDCLFIMAGSGNISGASLQVLKFLTRRFKVSVLYIKPDHELLGKTAYLQDRICYNILQEYARSGALKDICLVSNNCVEEILEDSLTTENYFDKINELICYTYHMLNVFKRTEPVLDNLIKNQPHSKISTIGLVDFDSGSEKMLFPLDKAVNKCYYYAISGEEIKNDYKILKKVNRQVKNGLSDEFEPSYQIHSTNYETNFAFAEFWSSKVQSYPEGGIDGDG